MALGRSAALAAQTAPTSASPMIAVCLSICMPLLCSYHLRNNTCVSGAHNWTSAILPSVACVLRAGVAERARVPSERSWSRHKRHQPRTTVKSGAVEYCPRVSDSRPPRIVRALARDRHIVHVALAQAGAGDAHELRLLVQVGQRARAHIAHGSADAAGELVQHVGDG